MSILFPKHGISVEYQENTTILQAMQQAGLRTDAPCGGHGKCGKCRVLADGREVFACRTLLTDGMTVFPSKNEEQTVILQSAAASPVRMEPEKPAPYHAAIDVGTTTVCCQILDGKTGAVVASVGELNAQQTFGADVVSRIQAALHGNREALTEAIRAQLGQMLRQAAKQGSLSLSDIGTVGLVGNSCMQQLFMGLTVDNLAKPPFPVLIEKAEVFQAKDYLSPCSNGNLLVIPNIFGYLGSDTVGCILAAGIHEAQPLSLVVDIGTNGEMVLGNRERLVSCATAAGPALEGAGIAFGMRGALGAIDHVEITKGELRCHVIGETQARGICGSGLIDAAAVLLKNGVINKRGRLAAAEACPKFGAYLGEKDGDRVVFLTESVYLTQEDIRQVQMAKGAIAAGIDLMMQELGVSAEQIQRVYLAGAFGSFIGKESACAIGLLPPEVLPKISVVGNAALEGCRAMVCDRTRFRQTTDLVRRVQALDLAAIPGFSRCFARHMGF